MRICTQISTGKIIEMQSHGTAGTLIANALLQGIAPGDLLEEVVTPEEYKIRMDIQEPPKPARDRSDFDSLPKEFQAVLLAASGKGKAHAKIEFKKAYDSL